MKKEKNNSSKQFLKGWPGSVQGLFIQYVGLGLLGLALFIAAALTGLLRLEPLLVCVASLCLLGLGAYKAFGIYKTVKDGKLCSFVGECIYIQEKNLVGKVKSTLRQESPVAAYHLDCKQNGIIAKIPAKPRAPLVPLGYSVRFYAAFDAPVTTVDGITVFSEILGYELLSKES